MDIKFHMEFIDSTTETQSQNVINDKNNTGWHKTCVLRCQIFYKVVPSKELTERLGLDDIISVLQQNRLQWYKHVVRKEDTDWVKKCMEMK